MSSAIIITIVIIAVASLIGLVVYGAIQGNKKRTADFAAAAGELGLQFAKDAGEDLQTRFADFRLFKHRGSIKNVTRGDTSQARLSIFDYTYSTGSGNNRTTHIQTVVAMESEGLHVPPFHLRPEYMFDTIGSVLGFQDIDFEHHPSFSKAYVLKSEKEPQTRAFFDDALLEFFAEKKSITFETRDGAFIYYRAGKTIKPEELRDFLGEGYVVFKAFTDRLARG